MILLLGPRSILPFAYLYFLSMDPQRFMAFHPPLRSHLPCRLRRYPTSLIPHPHLRTQGFYILPVPPRLTATRTQRAPLRPISRGAVLVLRSPLGSFRPSGHVYCIRQVLWSSSDRLATRH